MFSASKSSAPVSSAYTLTKSLRFRSSATGYLNRTPATATNRRTWTWSGWVKRGSLGTFSPLFYADAGGNTNVQIVFLSGDTLRVFQQIAGVDIFYLITTAVYRDPSAWYHIVVAVDTTQATNTNRLKMYVNGVETTNTSTLYPIQNFDGTVNNNVSHYISYQGTPSYFDGELADVYLIDGQALTPSSFGATNATTGQWSPARYTGTYGTNGFHLEFTNTTSTTTLGYDTSGNSNNWTTNNISLTAGSTYDSMNDVPVAYSATASNYCVLNPLGTAGAIPTDGNLAISSSATVGNRISTFLLTSGKWYWEAKGQGYVGAIIGADGSQFTGSISGTGSKGIGYWYGDGFAYFDGGYSSSGATSYTSTDVIGIALDMNAGNVKFYKNNTLIHNLTFGGSATSGTVPTFPNGAYPGFNIGGGTFSVTFNFGQQPFTYTPPSGYNAVNTYNLSAPTIAQGNKYMDATLYTGTLIAQSITNAGSFQPDFVWIKSRSATTDNKLTDSVRGTTKALISNTTGTETTDTLGVTAFNSNGFTISTDTNYNNSGATYVAWQWKAGGTAVSNTSGSITSSVSVNTTAGFSIVTYTGTGSNATVGHGLGVAPSMVIVKNRTVASNDWCVWHTSLTSGAYALFLDATNAQGSFPTIWNSTIPTSTVFSVGTATGTNSGSLVAYCFAQIAGFSAFGSYVGNGSTNGPFVYTGFKPEFILYKRSDTAGNSWRITDSTRSTYNLDDAAFLYPDTTQAENNNANDALDILSNGFKIRITDPPSNAASSTYIYMAFASNPFKYANAR